MHPGVPLTLTIEDVAFGGSGVARCEGKVVFVPFTITGEQVRAQLVEQKKSFAKAALFAVDTPSPDRVEAPCPYFTRCGGCVYQHIAYPRQLELKQQQVEQTLRRVGHFDEVPMRPIVPAPSEYGYRNRIRVHVAGGIIGFYEYGKHKLVDVEQCLIAAPEVNKALKRLHDGKRMKDGSLSLRARGAGPFFEQTNPAATIELLRMVRESIKPGGALLVDAYCGAGLFAKHLADLFEHVVGIERNASAIDFARRDASEKESYVRGDVDEHLGDALATADPACTTVILDPPAEGAEPGVIQHLLTARPAEIIYISCNPGTLARDLALLCARSYALEAVTPLDMFPQTAEIEVVAQLKLRSES